MTKINKTVISSKAPAHWNSKVETDQIVWSNFRNHMIVEYEKLLEKGGVTTLAQEGFETVFHTLEDTDNNTSLLESIV